MQDASGYVGQAIPPGVYGELLNRYGEDKILFKPEASPVGPNLSALRDATGGRAKIFEGSGGIFLIDSYRRGIAGTMPGADLLDGVVAVWRALQRGDEDLAYRVSYPVGAIVALQLQAGLDGFLAIEKHLMVERGLFPSARRRRPYGWDLDPETAAEVDRLLPPPPGRAHRRRVMRRRHPTISFTAADASTTLRMRRSVTEPKTRLPSVEPIRLPNSTATSHTGNSAGKVGASASRPASPAAEFTRMNAADTPAATFVCAHPANSKIGVR